MKLVDTDVLLPLFLETDFSPVSRSLFKADPDWKSEPLVIIECTNVLSTYVRVKRLTRDSAMKTLSELIEYITPRLGSVTHMDALRLAMRFGITGYDARYIALAQQLNCRLTTNDRKLRLAVPAYTQSVDQALAEPI